MTQKTKEPNTETKTEDFKIPQFLSCSINASANTVIYDNLNLKDVKGILYIKNQKATLKSLTSNIFDGKLEVNGDVSTKAEVPAFNVSLGANGFDVSKSFGNLDLLQALAPIAKVLQGKLNSSIDLSGTLNNEFTPNLNTVNGSAFAEILTSSFNADQAKLLSVLGNSLNFIDFKKLDLTDLKTNLKFANGKVNVSPFNLKYKDIDITVSGAHGFDKTLSYDAVFNVPAKYLGNEVNGLIAKINDKDVSKITIPVTANITGTFTNPQVKTDLASSISNLTKQLVEIEKQKLLNTGKDKIKELLGGIKGIDGNTKNDSTQKDSTIVQTDSVKVDTPPKKAEDQVEEGIKNILGGLIKNRKKKDSIE